LWPARSPDLNPCDFNLRGNIKDKVYSNNPHTLDELKQNTHETITSIKVIIIINGITALFVP
jgi:hypothetical protein